MCHGNANASLFSCLAVCLSLLLALLLHHWESPESPLSPHDVPHTAQHALSLIAGGFSRTVLSIDTHTHSEIVTTKQSCTLKLWSDRQQAFAFVINGPPEQQQLHSQDNMINRATWEYSRHGLTSVCVLVSSYVLWSWWMLPVCSESTSSQSTPNTAVHHYNYDQANSWHSEQRGNSQIIGFLQIMFTDFHFEPIPFQSQPNTAAVKKLWSG